MDKALKRQSWPGVARALHHCGPYVTPANKTSMRRYYVDGIEPRLDFADKPSLIARLLCEPDASLSDWERWKAETTQVNWPGTLRTFMGLQGDYEFYFGSNSLYMGRDKEIYDRIMKDYMQHKAQTQKIFGPVPDVISPGISPVMDYVQKGHINPYCQHWRWCEAFIESIRLKPDRDIYFDPVKDVPVLMWYFCPIVWGCQNALHFDPLVEPVVRCLYEFFTDPATTPVLREAFEVTVDQQLDNYVNQTAAGGRFCACIRYDTPEQLQAMLSQLSPNTRYPVKAERAENAVLALPNPQGRNLRISLLMNRSMWSAGFLPSRVIELDEQTIYIETVAPLGTTETWLVLNSTICNVINLEQRIKARKHERTDTLAQDATYAKGVYFIEPMKGDWRVGDLQFEEKRSAVFLPGDDAKIDKWVGSGKPVEEFLLQILNSEYERIERSDKFYEDVFQAPVYRVSRKRRKL